MHHPSGFTTTDGASVRPESQIEIYRVRIGIIFYVRLRTYKDLFCHALPIAMPIILSLEQAKPYLRDGRRWVSPIIHDLSRWQPQTSVSWHIEPPEGTDPHREETRSPSPKLDSWTRTRPTLPGYASELWSSGFETSTSEEEEESSGRAATDQTHGEFRCVGAEPGWEG